MLVTISSTRAVAVHPGIGGRVDADVEPVAEVRVLEGPVVGIVIGFEALSEGLDTDEPVLEVRVVGAVVGIEIEIEPVSDDDPVFEELVLPNEEVLVVGIEMETETESEEDTVFEGLVIIEDDVLVVGIEIEMEPELDAEPVFDGLDEGAVVGMEIETGPEIDADPELDTDDPLLDELPVSEELRVVGMLIDPEPELVGGTGLDAALEETEVDPGVDEAGTELEGVLDTELSK